MSIRTEEKDLPAVLQVALWLGALVLATLAAAALLKDRMESFAIALGAGSATLATGALLLHWPALLEAWRRPRWGAISAGLVAAWAAWGAIAAAFVVSYALQGWDESDYYLSGLALRGYPTHYAASRPPVAHFVAAIFADAPQLAGAALIAVLVVLVSVWSIQRWGWTRAALPLAMLAAQNLLLGTFFGFTSELPAAVLLVGAFLALARERFFFAGALFALDTLARWNLGVIPLAVAVAVAWRFGWKRTGVFALGGAAITAAFLGLSFALVPHPIQQIVKGNFLPAIAWAEVGASPPDLLSRSRFYLGNGFFLTPPAFVALAWSLRTWRRGAGGGTDDWCVRCAIPLGLAAYGLAMVNVGGHFPRFMAPILPLALFVLTDVLQGLSDAWKVSIACVTAAWGIWPADTLIYMKNRLAHQPVISPALRAAVAREVPAKANLCAPAIPPLTNAGGLPLMVEFRRELTFPQADRDSNSELLPIADPVEAVRRELAAVSPDAYYLIPIGQENLITGGRVVTKDDRWVIWQPPSPNDSGAK